MSDKEIKYFENGCLCLLTGRIEKTDLTGREGWDYYVSKCTCTRNPELNRDQCWDTNKDEREKALQQIKASSHIV